MRTIPRPRAPDGWSATPLLTVFSVLWGFAALFHMLNNDQSAAALTNPTLTNEVHAALGVAAMVAIALPRRLLGLIGLAVLGPVTAWLEAPNLGNHWLLAAIVDLGLLGCLLVARGGRSIDRQRLAEVFVPLARATVLVVYAFAAFSKLNTAFLDPSVSCGSLYVDEVGATFGLSLDPLTSGGVVGHVVPWLVIATEGSIPVLLAVRRTRLLGVAVALLFHGAIALDLQHLFADFSATLDALFVLFLPADFYEDSVELARRIDRNARGLLAPLLLGLAAVLLLALWLFTPRPTFAQNLLFDLRMPFWFVVDALVVATVAHHLWHHRVLPPRGPRTQFPAWLAIVPALAAFNGLTPYLELKTGYAWNMYSNLRTAAGQSNHVLVRATAHLSSTLDNPVTIIASSDPGLQAYADQHYDLPMPQLRAYLSTHLDRQPPLSLDYRQGGVEHRVVRVADDPLLSSSPPTWELRLQPFRALDEQTPVRCAERFLAAQ